MNEIDVNKLANAKAKGKRPYFFDDPAVERVLSITMAVATELAVNRERLDISVKEGSTERLKITKGIILISGLNELDQTADIDFSIEGPLQEHLQLIDHKPLNLSLKQGISPELTKGDALTHLKISFPMEADLKLDKIDVLVTAQLRNVAFPSGKLGNICAELSLGWTSHGFYRRSSL